MRPPLRAVYIVPHTHWDREWYQQEHLFRLRLIPTIDRVLVTLRDDPGFAVFLLDGQTGLLDDYLAVRPEQVECVRDLIASGRLLVGPWYVLADEFLLTDECLVRNLMLGRVTGERLGGWLPIGHCPDSFGHPANLPAILNGFGIDHAIVWRGYGGRRGEDGDLFRWHGVDGSSVLAYHLPPTGYEVGAELPVGHEDPRRRWATLSEVLRRRTVTGSVMLPSGADHHGIQPDLPAAVNALRAVATDVVFHIASPVSFFTSVEQNLPDDLRDVHGELRFSYGYTWTLQGVHSTRARIKRRAAEAERMLVRWMEPQCALAFMETGTDRRPLLQDTWREFLRSCAHDSIGGCCTDDVATDTDARFARCATAARQLFVDAVWDRTRQDRDAARRQPDAWSPRLLVVNPTPSTRPGVVESTVTFFRAHVPVGSPNPSTSETEAIPGRNFHLIGPNGRATAIQIMRSWVGYERLDSPRNYPDQDLVDAYRVAFFAESPALGIAAYRIVEGAPSDNVDSSVADSPRVRVVRAKLSNGTIDVSGAGRPFALTDGSTNLVAMADLVSETDLGDTYTFQPVASSTPLTAQWDDARVVCEGPVVGCIARDFRIGNRVSGTVYARLRQGERFCHWIVAGTNHTGNHRLRILFSRPRGSGDVAVVDQHFGPIDRPRETAHPKDFPSEHPVCTAPCHRYVSLRGQDTALTVFPRGVFEYELTDDHVALTVLRAVSDLSKGNLAARPGHAAWPVATPEAQEIGEFSVEIATTCIGVDRRSSVQDWRELEAVAETFHAPLAGVMMRHAMRMPDLTHGPRLGGDGLVFKSLLPARTDGAVVWRCVNVTPERVRGEIEWPRPFERAARCRLDESVLQEIEVAERHRVTFEAAPHEIVSFLFWFSRMS